MLITYWAAKGGSGTTVLAAAHALQSAARGPVLLVDLDGDVPAVLGTVAPSAGIAEWLCAGADVPSDALDRLAVDVAPNLRLLPRGRGRLDPARAEVLAALLAGAPGTVIVDAGTRPGRVGRRIAVSSRRSILVTRACYLAVQRQLTGGLAPTEVALVREAARALRPDDIAQALGVPVRTTIPHDPGVARAVDAGLLASRLPRALARRLDPGRAA